MSNILTRMDIPRAMVTNIAAVHQPTTAIRWATVFLFVALTAATSQISLPLPFTPVPMTIQPMIVLLSGAVLGSRLGASCQFLYLAIGIAGLPAFAASPLLAPGLGRLLGPTAGYLMSYPIAALVVGALVERGFNQNFLTRFISMGVGLCLIFAGGVTWLTWSPWTQMSFGTALEFGFSPFVLVDLIKLGFAAAILPVLTRMIGNSSVRR
jgi:biotin transport system substrate-specific component